MSTESNKAVAQQFFMEQVPPTGKPVDVSAIAMMRFVDGKVVQLTAQFDQVGMMQQLGLIPTPGA